MGKNIDYTTGNLLDYGYEYFIKVLQFNCNRFKSKN